MKKIKTLIFFSMASINAMEFSENVQKRAISDLEAELREKKNNHRQLREWYVRERCPENGYYSFLERWPWNTKKIKCDALKFLVQTSKIKLKAHKLSVKILQGYERIKDTKDPQKDLPLEKLELHESAEPTLKEGPTIVL